MVRVVRVVVEVGACSELEAVSGPEAGQEAHGAVELALLDAADEQDPLEERLGSVAGGDELPLELPAELGHDGLEADRVTVVGGLAGEGGEAEAWSAQALARELLDPILLGYLRALLGCDALRSQHQGCGCSDHE